MAKETKKTAEEIKAGEQEKTLLASATEYDTVAYGEQLDLSESEQIEIIRDIESCVNEFRAQRSKENIEQEWRDALDLHNGVVSDKDFPYENCHNLHVHITSMVDNILGEKIRKRTFTRPMMLARVKPNMQNVKKFSVQNKERYINDKVLGEMKLEDDLSLVIDDAIKLGTGIGKIRHVREIDIVRKLEVYEPTVEDITRFITDFSESKDTADYKENLATLRKRMRLGEKEEVSVWVESEEVVKFQPVFSWVDPFNVYMDYYIKDIKDHRVIAEKMREISWNELKRLFESGYFDKRSESILADLEKKYGKEHVNRKYTLWEVNYSFKYKKKEIKSIITYVEDINTRVAKAISFPYMINRPNYEIYKIINRRNSIYGIGIPSLLQDTNVAINEFWNLNLDSAEFTIAPMMYANITSSDFDPSSKKFGPATIWWLGANDKINQLNNTKNIGDSYKLLSFLHQYAEWVTGVSAYMTGQANTLDPSAPASKAYMLLQESNLRINSYIRMIDQSNIRLFESIDALYYQYYNDSIRYYEYSDDKGYLSQEITRKELGIPANWIPQLSDISVNKALEKEENYKLASFLYSSPMVQKMPKAQRRIIEIILRAQGGEWEKSIPDLIPDGEETEVVDSIMKLMQTVGPKQIMDIMSSMMQGATPPGAGGGSQLPGAPDEAIMGNPQDELNQMEPK